MTDHRAVNREKWDEQAPAHAAPAGYRVQRLADDPTRLNAVVRFDLPRLETDVQFEHTVEYDWNHSLGDIVTALIDAGFTLTALQEHDSVPWEALPGLMTSDEHGEYRLTDRPERLPCSYTLQAWLDRS